MKMEKIQGMVSDIVFKNEENGYTIANLANEDDVCQHYLWEKV